MNTAHLRFGLGACSVFFVLLYASYAFAGKGSYRIESLEVDGQQQDVALFDLYLEADSGGGGILSRSDVSKIETAVDETNKILFDATEGQFLVDELYIVPPDRNGSDQFADIIYEPVNGRSKVVTFSGSKGPGSMSTQL